MPPRLTDRYQLGPYEKEQCPAEEHHRVDVHEGIRMEATAATGSQ